MVLLIHGSGIQEALRAVSENSAAPLGQAGVREQVASVGSPLPNVGEGLGVRGIPWYWIKHGSGWILDACENLTSRTAGTIAGLVRRPLR